MSSLQEIEEMERKLKSLLRHIEGAIEMMTDEVFFDPTLCEDIMEEMIEIEQRLNDIIL